MIKVLVVDDSPVSREFIAHLLAADPEIEVIGTARDGAEAVEFVSRKMPDVVTMDIIMPVMNGLEATRRIMEKHPLPIVVVSNHWDPSVVATTFQALEAGALAIVQRPKGIGHPDHEATALDMVRKVKLMSEVRVVGRRLRKKEAALPEKADVTLHEIPIGAMVVAIGASTGGPPVIRTILQGLPRDFPVPVLVVQHIASGFLKGMVDWLADSSSLPMRIAIHGEALRPGQVYFAPEGQNMGLEKGGNIQLSEDGADQVLKPSVDHLFRCVANLCGPNAVGLLLSGMGRDGAEGLKQMRAKGGLTIIQDRLSSVVFGMPGAALELGAAEYVLPPDKMVALLSQFTKIKRE